MIPPSCDSVSGLIWAANPPDETTICKFRHLLETHELGKQLFARIGTYLVALGLTVNRGTIVDATIISDPEMHRTPLIHSVAAAAANVPGSQVLSKLLHGREARIWGHAVYSGQRDVI
ncbi:MAG: Mobile element protein [Nitrospira sp.]|jgi:IS5 family transposase|nr:MAG: Mobile element protein [Nitrospira sp.]